MLAYVRRANVSGKAPQYEPPRPQPGSYSPPPPPSRPKQDYSDSRSSSSSGNRESSSSSSSSRGYSSSERDDDRSQSSSRRESRGGFDFGFKNGSSSNDWMSGGGGMGMPSWQKGMDDAAARVKDAESNANSMVRGVGQSGQETDFCETDTVSLDNAVDPHTCAFLGESWIRRCTCESMSKCFKIWCISIKHERVMTQAGSAPV